MSLILEKSFQMPKGWTETTLEEISIKLKAGGTPSTKISRYYENGKIPFVKIDDMTSSYKYLDKTTISITEEGLNNCSAWMIPENSILYSMYASYGIPIINRIKVATSQAIIAFVPPKDLLDLDYVYYYLQSIKTKLKPKGTTQGNLNAEIIRNLSVRLAPLNEQKRIVSKIEELFSIIDSNIIILNYLLKQIELYEESILRFAYTGLLTKEWRESKKDQLETSDQVLQRLRIEKQKKGQRFSEISEQEVTKLTKLPENWSWTYLSNLGDMNRGKSKHRPRDDPILFNGKYPFIQTGIIRNSQDKIIRYEQTYNEVGLAQSKLFPEGTLCITIAANIAETGILTFPACFPDSIVGFNGTKELIDTSFVMYYVKSNKKRIESIAPATAQKNINLNILQNIVIPIMSYHEQCEIDKRIEHGISISRKTRDIVDSQIKYCDKIKNSILKLAFEGKLVPQDPNDEPAEILLKKIKQENQKIIKAKSVPKRRRNSQ